MSVFKIKDVDKGIYTKTESKIEEIDLRHIRNMVKQREDKIVELNDEITYFKDKETAIMALPNFKEPTK